MRFGRLGKLTAATVLVFILMTAPAFGQAQMGELAQMPVQTQTQAGDLAGMVMQRINFGDVEGHWAQEQIQKMVAAGLFNGVGNNLFDPNGQMTRAQAAVMFTRALGLEAQAEGDGPPWQQTFGDEERLPLWARNHIRVCYNSRLMLGEVRGDGLVFNPNKPLTRLEMTIMLVRAANREQEALALMGNRAGLSAKFVDHAAVPDWAVGYVLLAHNEAWVNGYEDHTFQPNRAVNRAEATALMERLENHFGIYWGSRTVGILVSIANGQIVITPEVEEGDPAPENQTFTLAEGVLVFVYHTAAELGELEPGQVVKLYVQDGLVLYIQAEILDIEWQATMLSASAARQMVISRFGGIIQKIEYAYDDTNPMYKGEALKAGSKVVFEINARTQTWVKWDTSNEDGWDDFAHALANMITMNQAADSVIRKSGQPGTFVQKIDFLWDDSEPLYQGEAFRKGIKYSFEIYAYGGNYQKWDIDTDDDTWAEKYHNVR